MSYVSAGNLPFGTAGVFVETFVDTTDYTSGTTTQLTLANNPANQNTIWIMFDGVVQHHTEYSIAINVITFNEAIPTGTAAVEVQNNTEIKVGEPADGSITAAHLVDDYVDVGGDIMTGTLTFSGLTTNEIDSISEDNGDVGTQFFNIHNKDHTGVEMARIFTGRQRAGVQIRDNVGVVESTMYLLPDGNVLATAAAPGSDVPATPTLSTHLINKNYIDSLPLLEYSETGVSYGTTGAIALDVSTGTYFYPSATTTGVITFSFTNPAVTTRATTFTLELLGAGNNTPVWPGTVTWANGVVPTWSTGTDIVSFITRDNGTTWYGFPSVLNDNTIDLNNNDILNARSITFNSEVVNTGTTPTIDWTAGQKQIMTVTTATTVTLTAPSGPSNLTLKVVNGGTGAITWPAAVKWQGATQPVWTTTGTDIASFYFDGTNYYGMAGLNFS